MKISIKHENSPFSIIIEGSDEATESLVMATKSLLKDQKIWLKGAKAQMSFDGDKKSE